MRRGAASSVMSVVATAVAIAGCGGGGGGLSNQEYAKQLKALLTPVGKSLSQLQSQAGAANSRQELTSALGAADDALQKASDGIGALDPPSDAASSNADLVTALDTYEKSIAGTEETARSGTPKQIAAQATSLRAASQAFTSSLTTIKGQLQSEGVKVSGGG
jgi:hypothetical protein